MGEHPRFAITVPGKFLVMIGAMALVAYALSVHYFNRGSTVNGVIWGPCGLVASFLLLKNSLHPLVLVEDGKLHVYGRIGGKRTVCDVDTIEYANLKDRSLHHGPNAERMERFPYLDRDQFARLVQGLGVPEDRIVRPQNAS